MKTATTIIAHPTTSEQVAALKAFVKALKIKFEINNQDEKPMTLNLWKWCCKVTKILRTGISK